tara:strand:+ start:44608 stop:45687 length:1080 start_codon:yes stop_codon:yes gene_type:complete
MQQGQLMRAMRVSLLLCLLALCLPGARSLAAGVNEAALLNEKPARLLSEYNLFSDGPAQIPVDGVLPYDLVTPLFSDYASKFRFVHVPLGKTAAYADPEVFDFPVGSALIKTFAYPADLRAPQKDVRLIETRLLIRQPDGWKAWAYVWNDDMRDARLKLAGKRLHIETIGLDGGPLEIDYAVPNANQCKGCHALGKTITPIGPAARHLNRDYVYREGVDNQLLAWSKRQILSAAPRPQDAPRAANWQDTSEPIDRRARSYLDINCAHCHRLEGPASNSGLVLTFGESDKRRWGHRKRPVAAGRGSGGYTYDIDPGKATSSILIFRMKSQDPGIMMPELGRSLVHSEAVTMLEAWIDQME